MSAVHVLVPVEEHPKGKSAPKRNLKAVPEATPARVRRFPFVLGLVALIAVAMGGLVVVNTQIQTQAAELATLERRAATLGYQQAALEADVNQARSAGHLEQQAHNLGMRPNPNPAFIVLPEGKILGTPTVVTGNEMDDQVYLTWEQVVKMQEDARLQIVKDKQAAAEAAKKKAAEEQAKKKAEDEAAKKKAADEAATKTPAATKPTR